MKKKLALVVALMLSAGLWAHAGGLDSSGGHYHKGSGKYHCHRADCIEQPASAVQGGQAAAPLSYDRSHFGGWIDADKDGQNTREEVLEAESLCPVKYDAQGKISYGCWFDEYTGKSFNKPSDLDIDHYVPLKDAFESGAASWPRERKRAFANELEDASHLIAVSASANRSKGDKPPYKWLPPRAVYHCEYVSTYVQIKEKWELRVDERTVLLQRELCSA